MQLGPISITAGRCERFFIDQPEGGHWFIVEEKHRDAWYAWRRQPDAEFSEDGIPSYARLLPDGPHRLSFQHPEFS